MSETKVAALSVAFLSADGAECGVDESPVGMRLTWGDGTVQTVERDVLMADACMWHGAKQKLVDGAAIARNTETGRSATIADKRAAVDAIVARMAEGEWFARREGNGVGTLLLAAMLRVFGAKNTPEAIRAKFDALTPDERRTLERNPKIAPAIEAIRTERRLAAGRDGDDGSELLAGLSE